MKWYKHLYFGESVVPKARRIISRVKKGKLTADIYLLALPSNPENLLDIIPAKDLLQKGYPKETLRIIGLAKGKKEALALVTQIVDEVFQETGDVKLVDYLKEKWRDEV